VAGVDPEHGDLAGGRALVSLEDLDDRGLAVPVPPEQGKDLATVDIEVDAPHRLDRAGVLAEPAH
jgi:hypothetical protein